MGILKLNELQRAKEYFTSAGQKRLLAEIEDDRLLELYKTIRAVQDDKSKFDELTLKVLEKRPASEPAKELSFKIFNKLTKRMNKEINKLRPGDDEFTVINKHGFSINYQYKALEGGKKEYTTAFKYWVNTFPVDELPDVDGIDFSKPVDLWLRYVNINSQDKRTDVTNFIKSTIDIACKHWGVDDNNINLKECSSIGQARNYDEGKIYICIRQGK